MESPKRTLSAVAVERAEVEMAAQIQRTADLKESWICCSGNRCSREATKYGVSVGAAILLMAFCVGKLASGPPDPLFIGLLSLCTGVLLPSPSMGK